MKFRVKKITSVTLLASMMLSAVSPPADFVMASGNETEMSGTAVVDTEGVEAAVPCETVESEDGVTVPGPGSLAAEEKGENAGTSEEETGLAEAETDGQASEDGQAEKAGSEKQQVAETGQAGASGPEGETEEGKEAEPIKVELALENPEPSEECPDPRLAGVPQNMKVSVMNPTEEDVQLRLYFWDYDGEETDGKRIPDEALTEACGDVRFPDADESSCLQVILTGENGSEISGDFAIQDEMEGEKLLARYLEMVFRQDMDSPIL